MRTTAVLHGTWPFDARLAAEVNSLAGVDLTDAWAENDGHHIEPTSLDD